MISKEELICDFSKKAESGHAAFFIGAGISVPYGLPNFQKLIDNLAEGVIDLEITSNQNYPEIAQFILNEQGNKEQIILKIQDEFNITYNEKKSSYLRSIAQSNVSTIWTTNYDLLIEQSLASCEKKCCVKNEDEQFKVCSSQAKL